MPEVSKHQLNISLAGQIALNLDKKDELGQDGKITKNIWDDFWSKNGAEFKGKNENIGEDGLTVQEAMGLIMTRLFNAAKATGKSVDEIAKNLFKESGGEKIDADTVKFADEEEVPPTKEAAPVEEVKEPEKATISQKQEEDFSKYDSLIREYQEKEKNVRSAYPDNRIYSSVEQIFKYVKGEIKYVNEDESKYKVTKDSVAYTLNELFRQIQDRKYIANYANDKKMQEVVWGLMPKLIEKCEELGIKYDKNIMNGAKFNISNKDAKAEIKRLVNEILRYDFTIIYDCYAYETLKNPKYSNRNRTITIDSFGMNRSYEYDENGRLSKITDRDGNVVFSR